MDEDKARGPALGAEAEAARVARQAREAAALRENLRRRKAQARARDAVPEGDENSADRRD
jgi:hypothetical protein